jgi:hypothetical protein
VRKKTRKLRLNRETLLNLEGDLRRVAGRGDCTLEDMTTCVCTDACNSGGGGTGSAACSGPQCPTLTWLDLTCCGDC